MLLMAIPPGEMVSLEFKYNDKLYSMQVELFKKTQNFVLIPAILNAGKPIPISELENPAIVYKTDKGCYTFDELELKAIEFNNNSIYEVKCKQNIRPNNRREAFRLYVGEEVTLKKIVDERVERSLRVALKDISVTGMGIATVHELEIGSVVEVIYTAKDKLQMTLRGTIVRQNDLGRKGKSYGIKFDNRTESLSKFILNSQIKCRSNMI